MQIREALLSDAQEMAQIKIAAWQATYTGMVQDASILELDAIEQEARFADLIRRIDADKFLLVAVATDATVVGYVSGGPERSGDPDYRGEVYAIYLHPAYKRQGIGRLLLRQAAQELLNRGFETMLLHTFAFNPARRFYEALGGQYLRSHRDQYGHAMEEVVVYGWQDLWALATETE